MQVFHAVYVLDDLHGRLVNAHGIRAAVHTVHQRHAQHREPQPAHRAGIGISVRQRFVLCQTRKRNADPERMAVGRLKQLVLNGEIAGRVHGALFQQRVIFPAAGRFLRRADARDMTIAVPGQDDRPVPPDGLLSLIHI